MDVVTEISQLVLRERQGRDRGWWDQIRSCLAEDASVRLSWFRGSEAAQWHAERRARRPKVSKLAAGERLRDYVQDRLGGAVTRPDGESAGRCPGTGKATSSWA